ncbi:MAG: hypothetical protein IPN29_05180 [Saprospiraceae bacterium]|nr:hypothetical protein [Saprospiraceae bacterium]
MILYNPKEWWRLIFAFHESDTFRKILPGIFGVAIYTGVVAYLENDVFHVGFKNSTAIHSLVGFVLSLLLVFRTNTAYDRWWDGRKLWGTVLNDSRNLAMKLSGMLESKEDKRLFQILISNYAIALRDHLRGSRNPNNLQDISTYDLDHYERSDHLPNCITKALYKETGRLFSEGKINGEQLLFLNEQLQSLVNTTGACERIKNTPIPYSYNIFLKKVIFIYVFSMPIGFVREFGYWAMPIVAGLFYIFVSIELIAEEIEDPFGTDSNDLPIDQICTNIGKNLDEILD